MLLTIKQSAHPGFHVHESHAPPTPPPSSSFRFSPNKALPPLPKPKTEQMSTPHRGLPPPSTLNLPQPTQQQQQQQQPPPLIGQPPLSQPMGQLPAPPSQWTGAEESMRNWLHAKAEEDKRKQEEEKTRQEALRLEQRKIEQDMLRTSLSGGIPPYMIPLVFAGMGGGNLPNASLEWAQHYMAQAHQLQQQQLQQQQQLLPSQGHTSPEMHQRRDSRGLAQPYGGPQLQQPLTLPSTPIGAPSSQQSAGYLPSYSMSPASVSRQSTQQGAIIRSQQQTSQLPRLNTGEMHIQPPPAGPSMQIATGQPGHPLSQSQTAGQQESQSSPSIYFHHWQPPTSQASTSVANQPSTPSDHTSSPRKRKATGPQQAAPPPTSQPQHTSPPFSQTGSSVPNTPLSRRRGHSRQRSEISTRGPDSYGRPGSRHPQGEIFSQSMASPSGIIEEGQRKPSGASAEPPRRRSGGSNTVSSILEQSDSRPQQSAQQHDPQYSAGPERRHEERRITPEEDTR